jgi:hypothetical protein
MLYGATPTKLVLEHTFIPSIQPWDPCPILKSVSQYLCIPWDPCIGMCHYIGMRSQYIGRPPKTPRGICGNFITIFGRIFAKYGVLVCWLKPPAKKVEVGGSICFHALILWV